MHTDFRTQFYTGVAIGGLFGLAIFILLFNNVGWYHDFVVWQYSHPLYLLPCAAIGAYIGWATD